MAAWRVARTHVLRQWCVCGPSPFSSRASCAAVLPHRAQTFTRRKAASRRPGWPPARPFPVTQLLTIDEAAARLAVSRRTVGEMLTAGQLSRIKVRSCTRVDAREVDALVERSRASEPPVVRPLSDGQLAAFHAKANELDRLCGLQRGDSKQAALALASRWFGRPVGSSRDLTFAEASRVLDHLDDEIRDAR